MSNYTCNWKLPPVEMVFRKDCHLRNVGSIKFETRNNFEIAKWNLLFLPSSRPRKRKSIVVRISCWPAARHADPHAYDALAPAGSGQHTPSHNGNSTEKKTKIDIWSLTCSLTDWNVFVCQKGEKISIFGGKLDYTMEMWIWAASNDHRELKKAKI